MEVNATNICLIPKVEQLEFVSQFCPISMCNVVYNVLTKTLVNHLKALIPELITPQQTGFIPSRSIHDNIVVAQEMMHSMRWTSQRPMTKYVGLLWQRFLKKLNFLRI